VSALGDGARTGLKIEGRDEAPTSIPFAPSLQQHLATKGWSVEPISSRAVKLVSPTGSILVVSRHKRHRANTLARVAAADAFARRR
jgi:hypothetical protein